jgi:hypothetical protein
MRTAARALLIMIAIAFGASAAAQAQPAQDQPPPAASDQPDLTPHVDPSLLSERHMREPEILHEKPSGFWTSNRPAVGGAYRYPLLLLGVGIAAIMGAIIVVVIRRNTRRPTA